MSTKEKKKKLTLKNFTGNAPSSVNKKQAQKTSAIFGKKEEPKVPNSVIEKSDSTTTPESKPSSTPKTIKSPEKPKSAKEWAKIKIQEELSKKADKKAAGKKRDYRLTVTKALSEEEEVQVRSLAAVKRSREKLFKKQSDQDTAVLSLDWIMIPSSWMVLLIQTGNLLHFQAPLRQTPRYQVIT